MHRMSATRSASGPEETDAGSWASETLPMSVRKQLLERELSKLGLRKAVAQFAVSAAEGARAQQPGDAGSAHPQADPGAGGEHAG